MLTIVVNATALASGGGLSILMQFVINAGPSNIYHVYCQQSVKNLPERSNIFYHPVEKMNAFRRIYWDCYGLKSSLKKRGISPDVVVSLQNTTVNVKADKHIVYLHQGIFLSDLDWSFFKSNEKKYAFYKYIYPFFVFLFNSNKVTFVVQTEWMRQALISKFKIKSSNVRNIKPDVLKPNNLFSTPTTSKENEYFNFFYPASSELFKNHRLIVETLNVLKLRGEDLSKIRISFTFDKADFTALSELIDEYKLSDNFLFLGSLSYPEVIKYYMSSDAVIFPSEIESFGLPLLEAAYLGKRIIALDTSFAREVLEQYVGVKFVPKDKYIWAEEMFAASKGGMLFFPGFEPRYKETWDTFFTFLSNTES